MRLQCPKVFGIKCGFLLLFQRMVAFHGLLTSLFLTGFGFVASDPDEKSDSCCLPF